MESSLKDLGARLKEYIDYKRIGTNQLGRMMGSSGALASNILNGKNFGMNKFLAIGSACPDLNLCWLLTGQGKMLVDGKAEKTEAVLRDREQSNKALKSAFLRETLELKISSLESAVAYQDMTIDAYKNTLSTVLASNKDLKEVLNHQVETINRLTAGKKTA